jgi:CMP-N-acetylneuraminic acid synthetase
VAFQGRRVLAVVPARSGSKGIARKNLEQVGGHSLIGHCGRTIGELNWIDQAVISTDDDEMAEEAERYGLAAPFRRPGELASDEARAEDAWRHAWRLCERFFGERFDLGLWLQPTTPLRVAADVERTVRTMIDGEFDSAATVSAIPAHLRPERAMTLSDEGVLDFYSEAGRGHANRQSIPVTWYRNGVCYAATRDTVVEQGRVIGDRSAGVPVEGIVVSIDEPFDLEMARTQARLEGGRE